MPLVSSSQLLIIATLEILFVVILWCLMGFQIIKMIHFLELADSFTHSVTTFNCKCNIRKCNKLRFFSILRPILATIWNKTFPCLNTLPLSDFDEICGVYSIVQFILSSCRPLIFDLGATELFILSYCLNTLQLCDFYKI